MPVSVGEFLACSGIFVSARLIPNLQALAESLTVGMPLNGGVGSKFNNFTGHKAQ